MLKLGLTGGIASGKTYVAEKLRRHAFHVLDADSIGHTLMEPGQPAYEEILQAFGPELLGADKFIDRKRLGTIVFADNEKLARLDAILHPKIEAEISWRLAELQEQRIDDAAFVEAALLVEAGMHKRLDGLVVVSCRPEQQIERLVARGMSEEEAGHRISLQMPNEEKLKYAAYVIDTSGTVQETAWQVYEMAIKLRKKLWTKS